MSNFDVAAALEWVANRRKEIAEHAAQQQVGRSVVNVFVQGQQQFDLLAACKAGLPAHGINYEREESRFIGAGTLKQRIGVFTTAEGAYFCVGLTQGWAGQADDCPGH